MNFTCSPFFVRIRAAAEQGPFGPGVFIRQNFFKFPIVTICRVKAKSEFRLIQETAAVIFGFIVFIL